ncbi:hypothetical protein [Hydrococcus rivularis]|uniref:hypothetical protein n=1 Tax=Hydrococcus rivularis TaxID=1616834 RepID=UPI001114A228|nr:hypothetical protein [Hydrococcus rivularis]
MTQIVDRPHPQPLYQIGRGEKNVDRENLKIGIRLPQRTSVAFFFSNSISCPAPNSDFRIPTSDFCLSPLNDPISQPTNQTLHTSKDRFA